MHRTIPNIIDISGSYEKLMQQQFKFFLPFPTINYSPEPKWTYSDSSVRMLYVDHSPLTLLSKYELLGGGWNVTFLGPSAVQRHEFLHEFKLEVY